MKLLPIRTTFFMAAAVFVMMVFALSGCSGDELTKSKETKPTAPSDPNVPPIHIFRASDVKSLKLAFVPNGSTEFWNAAVAGVRKYEKESGLKVDIRMPSNGTVGEQNSIIRDLVRQGYNGIAVSVVSPNDQVSIINEAASVTNVICFDSDCPKSNRILYIGTDNFEAGKVLGGQIVRLLPSGGQMAVFAGSFSGDNARQRLSGIQTAIEHHNIEIVAKKEDGRNRALARANVEETIRMNHDLGLVCGLWSYNGPAIATAIEATGRKGTLLAAVFDEQQGTLDAIKAGVINCTVVQKPFQFGYLSSRWLHELAVHGAAVALPEDRNMDTGVRVIDSTSVNDFETELAQMKVER